MEHDVIHFKADEQDGTRLITQFYAFLWFEDWMQDLWAKRFIRDHLRYRDEIMCLAARVVAALRAHARQNSLNFSGDYDAIHIRRTDFQSQFPATDLSSNELLLQIQQTVKIGSTLFIATDENNRTFFSDIEAIYDVKYLGDFSNEISSINPNYFGLVEQIVASRSRYVGYLGCLINSQHLYLNPSFQFLYWHILLFVQCFHCAFERVLQRQGKETRLQLWCASRYILYSCKI